MKDSALADGAGSGIHYFMERQTLGESFVLTQQECKQIWCLQLWRTHNNQTKN